MKAGRIAFVALIVFALLAIPLAVYIGGYLYLGKTSLVTQGRYIGNQIHSEPAIRRQYRYRWEVSIFTPLGGLETWLRGIEIDVVPDPPAISLDVR